MAREPIQLNDDKTVILDKMSEGDTGARIIAHYAIQRGGSLGPSELLRLDSMGMRGSDLVVAAFASAYTGCKRMSAELEALRGTNLNHFYERDKFDPKALIQRLWSDMQQEIAAENAEPRLAAYDWKAKPFRSQNTQIRHRTSPIPPAQECLHEYMGVSIGLGEERAQQRLADVLTDRQCMGELAELLPDLPKLSAQASLKLDEFRTQTEGLRRR